MARYSYGRKKRRKSRKSRKWVYVIFALIIVAAIILFVKRDSPENPDQKPPAASLEPQIKLEPEPEPEPEPELPQTIPEPAVESDPMVATIIKEAVDLLNSKPAKIVDARDRLNEVLPMAMSSEQRKFVRDKLTELADEWLFSRKVFPQDKLCTSYKVRSGDLISNIGKQFKVPYEILMRINNIARAESMRAGETIKVIQGPFHAKIYKSVFRMDLYLQNTFVRSFSVGLAKAGKQTPTGIWLVDPNAKLKKPTWTDPDTGKLYEAEDPEYPLGSVYIGLQGLTGNAKGRTGFAIHGTNKKETIGTASSRGCIRLHNGDAILTYNVLMQGLSRVEIVD